MRIAATGFVSARSGSIASAGALYLRHLLEAGHEVSFFSKATFVDPRPAAAGLTGLEFHDVENRVADRLRRACTGFSMLHRAACAMDSATYNRLLVRRMREEHARRPFDVCLWLGDFASGRVDGVPVVSFVQGAPGSDARSVFRHFGRIRRMGGLRDAVRLAALAALRLSPAGLPPFHFTDHFVVGGEESRCCLHRYFRIDPVRSEAIPYPVDLEKFRPGGEVGETRELRCLWLGRIVPRKRLDIFMEGAALAIGRGADLRIRVVGAFSFARGFESLLREFPFPERLDWVESIPRDEVPTLMRGSDVLVQPSEEEDFGSSVAEAQACGLPVVIGRSSGNADYVGPNDIVLAESGAGAMGAALFDLAREKAAGMRRDAALSRRVAEQHFRISHCGERLLRLLDSCVRNNQSCARR